MRLRSFAVTAVIASAAIFAASAASANVTYLYTGYDFTAVNSGAGYTTSDKITGTLTLSSALPDSLTPLTNEAALVVSYSFSDGVTTFANGCCETGNQTIFDFTTDASGNITAWDVTLETNDNHTGDLTTEGGATSFDQSLVDGVLGGDNRGEPGTWSIEAATSGVPEPASWALFILGLGAMGGMLRRARKPSAAAIPA